MTARITGAKELIRDLKSLGVSLEDLKRPFAAIAQRTAEIAAADAPKRSGRLAKSIRGSKSQNRASVSAGGARVRYAGPI